MIYKVYVYEIQSVCSSTAQKYSQESEYYDRIQLSVNLISSVVVIDLWTKFKFDHLVWATLRYNYKGERTSYMRYNHCFKLYTQYLTIKCFLKILWRLKMYLKDLAGFELGT